MTDRETDIASSMQKAALRLTDWFIPNAAARERSEIGLVRSFVITHLFGPLLILSIVVLTLMADPHPSIACWAMIVCVAGFWGLPFGLRATQDLQLMALVSIELLCVTSLIGTSFYGSVNSPFLPWLLVSLMLGFFYLSDHTMRVLALFGSNIVAMVGVHFVYRFPQHLSPADLSAINWFSMFSATAYMSIMAIYYARILTMRSELERETERHRSMAHQLRTAKRRADAASRGKTLFLGKMKQQFEGPVRQIMEGSQTLVARSGDASVALGNGELARIHATGRRLFELVRDAVDQDRPLPANQSAVQDVAVAALMDGILAGARKMLSPPQEAFLAESVRDLGRIRIDTGRLQQICENVVGKAAQSSGGANLRLDAWRHRRMTGDWIEIGVCALRRSSARTSPSTVSPVEFKSVAQLEAELDMAQLHCAVIGGTLSVARDASGALRISIELPTAPVELPPAEPADGQRLAS